MNKVYKHLEDVLPIGTHHIKVYPKNEWDKERKQFIKGTHRHGTSKTGNTYWLYTTKVNGEYIGLVAFDENEKAVHDQVDVEVNIVQRTDKQKKPVWQLDENGLPLVDKDGKAIPKLIAFINPIKKKEPAVVADMSAVVGDVKNVSYEAEQAAIAGTAEAKAKVA